LRKQNSLNELILRASFVVEETDKDGSGLLWDRRSGDRIPDLAIFSTPVQTDPGAHPASYTVGTGSFSGVKRAGRGVDHQHI